MNSQTTMIMNQLRRQQNHKHQGFRKISANFPRRLLLPTVLLTRKAYLELADRDADPMLGRSWPLNEAASSMLAQLLRKHGLGARVASYRSASREGITSLEVNGAAMVCISYLNIRGSPSHLRFLMQRLRKRLPAVPISVGLWPKGDKVLTDKAVSTAIGADYYVTSLREAVNACIETSKKAAIQSGPARDSRTGYQYPSSADPPEEKRV